MLTRFSWERLGEPEAFLLMYDSINDTIGLQPAKPDEENAFPAASHGTARGKVIYGFQMIQEFGLHIDEPIRFCGITINEEGVMLLDLKTAKPMHPAKAKKQ